MAEKNEETKVEKEVNYWGDMPADEFYASQGVKNKKEYFKTPHGTLFTQMWAPTAENETVKGMVCMTHGYGSDTSWMFQKIAIAYAQWGYVVYGADLLGHGRSDGIPCYMGDMDKIAAASLFFFKAMRDTRHPTVPHFLFGESMGGAVTLLMYFQDPEGWSGLIFSAPLFVMPEPMKPSWWRLTAYGLLLGLADTWAVMPDNKMVKKAIKDKEKMKIIASNPRRYTGKPRVGTMRELCRVCAFFQNNFHKVTVPFLTVHGTSDEVTSPESSKMLYEKAGSQDKSLILYDDMYHSLIQGEPDENSEKVLNDMRLWIDAHAVQS